MMPIGNAIARVFHPYRIPDDLPDRLKPVAQVLRTLRELHATRNHRPVADTIGRLIAVTRAHAGFVLWRGGEQALANCLRVTVGTPEENDVFLAALDEIVGTR